MKKELVKILLSFVTLVLSSQINAQDVITFDVNSRKQLIKGFDTWSEVNMYHPTMSPTPSDLVIDLNGHNFTLCLKPDIEQVNDNDDPYVTDFSKFNVNQGGNSGSSIARYFEYIREYKRLRDSMMVINPALKPFTLSLKTGFYDRYVPGWIKTTAPGSSQVDSAQFAEYAENIYAQCKLLKDSTGVDVTYIDPIPLDKDGVLITKTNLCKLIATLGTYLESRGLTPDIGFGTYFQLTFSPDNQAKLFEYITTVHDKTVK